jgi:hypothetical protein
LWVLPARGFSYYDGEVAMLVNGFFIQDGSDIIKHLDRELSKFRERNMSVSGIIIGTPLRKMLTKACQSILGAKDNPSETVNRFEGVWLIEDGVNGGRLEVIGGPNVTAPELPEMFGKVKKL